MRVLKSKVALLSLVVAGAFASTTATAATMTLAATCPATPLASFAIELPLAVATAYAGGPDTVVSVLGFGVAVNDFRYIRYDLSPGAKFAVTVLPGSLVVAGGNVPSVVQGGQAGDSYVLFQFNVPAAIPATNTATLTIPVSSVTLPVGSATQTIAYSLHETAVSGAGTSPSNTTRLSNLGPCAIYSFTKSYNFAIANVNEVVDAASGFKRLVSGNTTDTVLDLGGSITLGLIAVPPTKAPTGVAVTMSDLFTAATTLTVTSDNPAGLAAVASAANYGTSATVCTTPVPTVFLATATARTAAGATFNPGATVNPNATVHGQFLCATIDGVTTIPAQNVKATLVPGAGSGVGTTPIMIANNITTITQNGAVLQSPWFSINPAVVSFFFLTNTSSLDMAYTTTVYCENLNTCTPGTGGTGTILAGKSLRVDAAGAGGILASTSGPTRASVLFNIVGATGSVQADLVTVNPTTGNQTTSSHLVRPGTN